MMSDKVDEIISVMLPEEVDKDNKSSQQNPIPDERPQCMASHEGQHEMNSEQSRNECSYRTYKDRGPCDLCISNDEFKEFLCSGTIDDRYCEQESKASSFNPRETKQHTPAYGCARA